MPIQITSGPARVLHQGMVTSFWGHPIALDVDLGGEGVALGVVVRFTTDAAVPDVEVRSERGEDGVLTLELVNFDGADGRGSAQPVLLAELGPYALFFHFRVFRFGRTPDRTLHYTFYRVAKDDVGWQPV